MFPSPCTHCRVQLQSVYEDKQKVEKKIPEPQTLLGFQCCCQATLLYFTSNLSFLSAALKQDAEQSEFDRGQETLLTVIFRIWRIISRMLFTCYCPKNMILCMLLIIPEDVSHFWISIGDCQLSHKSHTCSSWNLTAYSAPDYTD